MFSGESTIIIIIISKFAGIRRRCGGGWLLGTSSSAFFSHLYGSLHLLFLFHRLSFYD